MYRASWMAGHVPVVKIAAVWPAWTQHAQSRSGRPALLQKILPCLDYRFICKPAHSRGLFISTKQNL